VLLSKKGVFWRGVLPSYTYLELNRTVILSNAADQARGCAVLNRLLDLSLACEFVMFFNLEMDHLLHV